MPPPRRERDRPPGSCSVRGRDFTRHPWIIALETGIARVRIRSLLQFRLVSQILDA